MARPIGSAVKRSFRKNVERVATPAGDQTCKLTKLSVLRLSRFRSCSRGHWMGQLEKPHFEIILINVRDRSEKVKFKSIAALHAGREQFCLQERYLLAHVMVGMQDPVNAGRRNTFSNPKKDRPSRLPPVNHVNGFRDRHTSLRRPEKENCMV